MKITDIQVTDFSSDGTEARFMWKTPEARYHFFADVRTRKIEGAMHRRDIAVVYKNPHAGYKEPGYFRTRYLDASSQVNAAMIAQVWKEIDAGDLITKGRARFDEQQLEAEKERKREAIDEAAAELRRMVQFLKKHGGEVAMIDALSEDLSMADLDALKARLP